MEFFLLNDKNMFLSLATETFHMKVFESDLIRSIYETEIFKACYIINHFSNTGA